MSGALPAGGQLPPRAPPSTSTIVDAAVEEAGQTLFTAVDVPLARSDELLLAVQGKAVRAVLEMRIEQMVKHGHTIEGDLDLPLFWLPREARESLCAAGDSLVGAKRNLVLARRRIVRAAALCLAAIDVLDTTIATEAE